MITILNTNFLIDSGYLWGFLALFILFFILMTIILKHHWNKYVIDIGVKNRTVIIFSSVAILFFLLATISLIFFELKLS